MLNRIVPTVCPVVLAVGLALGGYSSSGLAAEEMKDRAELARHMASAKMTLEDGLKASEREGKPISAKFEVEDGKLQFSAYTMKGDSFTEVVANPESGAVEKAEPITDPEDLENARQQRDAVTKATTSLLAATEKAVKANAGFRAVSIFPALKAGHPVAEVTLARAQEVKTASEKLD
jgi:hypothetical protein